MFVRLDGQKVVPIECQSEQSVLGIAAKRRSCCGLKNPPLMGGFGMAEKQTTPQRGVV